MIKRNDRRLEDDAIEQRLDAFIQEGQYFAARLLLKNAMSAERRSAWETYLNGAENELRVMQIDRFVAQGRYWEAHLEAACIRDAALRQQWRAYTNALYWQAQDYPEEVVDELDVPCQEVVRLPMAAAA